jgi:hypothetical protein
MPRVLSSFLATPTVQHIGPAPSHRGVGRASLSHEKGGVVKGKGLFFRVIKSDGQCFRYFDDISTTNIMS